MTKNKFIPFSHTRVLGHAITNLKNESLRLLSGFKQDREEGEGEGEGEEEGEGEGEREGRERERERWLDIVLFDLACFFVPTCCISQ